MKPENTDTPPKEDCPPAPCSPSVWVPVNRETGEIDRLGLVAFREDTHRKLTDEYEWREFMLVDAGQLVRLYNQGYHAGHEDTVEACFVPIHHTDMDTYRSDVVAEILQENVKAQRRPCLARSVLLGARSVTSMVVLCSAWLGSVVFISFRC